jgi:hypothetical protein
MVTQEIDLNLIPSSEPVVVHLSQYDEGYHRLICHLYAGAVPYEPVSPTVKVQGTKPDKHGFQYYCDIDGSTAYVDINLQMTACAGRVPTQLIVTESTGVTGSFAFELDVQESALVLDVDISETDIPIITEAAQEAARRSAQSAEQSAASAAEAAAWSSNPPYIGENLHWYVYDIQSEEFVDSGVVAEGKDGSLWYRGTAVYGKSLVPTIFDTDIEYAHTSDMYLNTTEGAIYHCVTPGADTVATWVYDMTLSGGGGGVTTLAELDDVTITTPSDNQLLAYDSNAGKWVNASVENQYVPTSSDIPISGYGVADAFASELQEYYTKQDIDDKLEVVVAYGGQKTFAELTAALLVAENENKFFLITTDGHLTSSDLANWAPSYIVGDHIAVDSHIAVVNFGTAANPSYKFDDFGGFVETDEYTPLATCRTENSQTIVDFDNLNPDYGYDINYEVPSSATTITVPTWTNVVQSVGTNTGTIKLTYTLSGATAGTDQFSLRIKK